MLREHQPQWRKLNVKQDQVKRLKPSRIANPKRSTRVSPVNNSISAGLAQRNSMPSKRNFLEAIRANGQSLKQPENTKGTTGHWNNPDFSTLNQSSALLQDSRNQGEIHLDHLNNDSALKVTSCLCQKHDHDHTLRGQTNLSPDSIQIKLLPKEQTSPPTMRGSSKWPLPMHTRNKNEQFNSPDQVKDRESMNGTLNGFFGVVKTSHQSGTIEQKRERVVTHRLGSNEYDGEAAENTRDQDINQKVDLIQLAETYRASQKRQQSKQEEFERRLLNVHREAQISRLSNSAIGEDHVLIGGRLTQSSGTGSTIKVPATTTRTGLTSQIGGDIDKLHENQMRLTPGLPTVYNVANIMPSTTPVAGNSTEVMSENDDTKTAAAANATVSASNMRQIVVQKKKESTGKGPNPRLMAGQGTLFKSQQDGNDVQLVGIIYQNQMDNLTISKDILFDDEPTPDHLMLQHQQNRHTDSSKYLALKELLRSQDRRVSKKEISSYRYASNGFQTVRQSPETFKHFDSRGMDRNTITNWKSSRKTNYNNKTVRTTTVNPLVHTIPDVLTEQNTEREFNTDVDSQMTRSKQPILMMPPIIRQIDQKASLEVRLATAKNNNTLLTKSTNPGVTYGMNYDFARDQRTIRTNQQNTRNPAGYGEFKKLTTDYIQMKEDALSSEYIKTINGVDNQSVVTINSPIKKGTKGHQTVYGPLNGYDAFQDVPLVPILDSLAPEIKTKEQIEKMRKASQNKSKHLSGNQGRDPMENVYRGLMAMSGSTEQMGVTISTNRPHKVQASLASKKESNSIGQTYMKSFKSQQYRQSNKNGPKSVIKRVETTSVSPYKKPLKSVTTGGKAGPAGARTLDAKTYQRITQKITSGSTDLVDKQQLQGEAQAQTQRLMAAKQLEKTGSIGGSNGSNAMMPHTDMSSRADIVPLGSKWYTTKHKNENSTRSLKSQHHQSHHGSHRGSRSQLGNGHHQTTKESFLVDTRCEMERMTQQQMLISDLGSGQKRILLNQPSQELVEQPKSSPPQKTPANAMKGYRKSREWQTLPIQHRDSTNWPGMPAGSSLSRSPDRRAPHAIGTSVTSATISRDPSPQKNLMVRAGVGQKQSSVVHFQKQREMFKTGESSISSMMGSSQKRLNTQTEDCVPSSTAQHNNGSFALSTQDAFYHFMSTGRPSAAAVPLAPPKGETNFINSQRNRHQFNTRQARGVQNRRAVGKAAGNTGTIHKGPISKTNNPDQRHRVMLISTSASTKPVGFNRGGPNNTGSNSNSQVAIGASQEQMKNRRLEFEQKQMEHIDQALNGVTIQQMAYQSFEVQKEGGNGAGAQRENLETGHSSNTASKIFSPPMTGKPRHGLTMRSSAPDLATDSQIHGIELVIEGTQRHELMPDLKPNAQSAMRGTGGPHNDMVETVPATKRGYPEQDRSNWTLEEPGTALIVCDSPTKVGGRNSALDQTLAANGDEDKIGELVDSSRDISKIESVLKKAHPKKKDTLPLPDGSNVLSPSSKFKITKPNITSVVVSTGAAQSNNIIIGGSMITSNRQLPNVLRRDQSPVNSDLLSVLQTGNKSPMTKQQR